MAASLHLGRKYITGKLLANSDPLTPEEQKRKVSYPLPGTMTPLPGSQLYSRFTVWPWAAHLTTQCLNLFIWKMKVLPTA